MCPPSFFLMLRRPPRSTLFPSRRSSDLDAKLFRQLVEVFAPHETRRARADAVDENDRQAGIVEAGLLVEDRKSTRLNSSHSQISYAVFCLKKKKKIC